MSLDTTGTEWEIVTPVTVDIVGGTGANTKSFLDHVLEGMIRAGLGIQAICLYLTLSAPELDTWVHRLDIPQPQDVPLRRPAPRRGWTASEVRQLIEWWGQGIRVGRIAEALGRSKSGIYTKKRRLGLPARERKSLVDRDLLGATDVCLGAGVEVERVEAPVATKRRKARRSPKGEAQAGSSATSEQEAVVFAPSGEGERVSAAVGDGCGTASQVAEDVAGVVEVPSEEHGSVRLGTASPMLLAAIAEAKAMTRYGCAGRPDWTRLEITEDEFYELGLRGFAGQTRFGVARDMGISAQAAADRMSRAGIGSVRRGLTGADWRQVDFFDPAVGLGRMRTSGAVARVCFETKRLHYVSREDRNKFYSSPDCRRNRDPEGNNKPRNRKGKAPMEREVRVRSAPEQWQDYLVGLECERKRSQAAYSAELDEIFVAVVIDPERPREREARTEGSEGLVERRVEIEEVG